MVEHRHCDLSLVQQCILLSISRSGLYYEPKRSLKEDELCIKEAIDRQYLITPYYGIRRMKVHLCNLGFHISRKRVSRYYKDMRITAIYPKPKMTWRNEEHKVYLYLLRNMEITHKNQVWSTDITYIPMDKGFMYLCAIIDWHSRYVLAWGISNTHDSGFCQTLLKQALEKHGTPEIFNTDQGSEFTATAFTDILKENGISISMDGRGRALDNIFVERLWRSVKYEYVYLVRPETGIALYEGLSEYFERYNTCRIHQSLGYKTPEAVYMAA
ncbi:MAG: IS3 family transposase [Bacteroidota bacterium]